MQAAYTYDCNGDLLLAVTSGGTESETLTPSTAQYTYAVCGLQAGYEVYAGSPKARVVNVLDTDLDVIVDEHTAVYSYNASGIRTCKIVDGVATFYLQIGGKVIGEASATENVHTT